MKFLYILTITLTFFCFSGKAQNEAIGLNHLNSVGLLTNIPLNAENLPEGSEYKPILIQANFRFPLLKKEGRNQLSLLVQPQFNPVLNINHQADEFIFEAGVNLGLAYEYLLSSHLILYAGAGVGPHYINVQTGIQADGFIFSDNFFIGMHQISADEKWLLSYEFRFRHISNAGLQSPNSGIDNFFGGIGIGYFIK